MLDELELRLQRAFTPEVAPDSTLHAAALAAALRAVPARRAWPVRTLRLVAPVMGFALAAGGLVLILPRGHAPTHAGSATLSVLSRPPEPSDRLPGWVLRDPAIARYGVAPATSRLARITEGRAYYVASAKGIPAPWVGRRAGLGQVCLIDAMTGPISQIARAGNPGGINCQDAAVLNDHFMVTRLYPSYTWPEIGIAPDGFDGVTPINSVATRTFPIVNNVWVVDPGLPEGGVFIAGAKGTRSEVNVTPVPTGSHARHYNPGDALHVIVSSSPSGPVGRWGFEPGAIEIRGAVRHGYTTATYQGRTLRIGPDRRFVFHHVMPTQTHPVTVTGPAGTAKVWVPPDLGWQIRTILHWRPLLRTEARQGG